MKQLLRSIFLVGLSSLANTGVSVVRNKILAVVLGPSGVGLFAQMFGLQTTAAGLVPIGMQTGALRFFALYRASDPQRLARFVHTATRMFFVLSVLATALCLVFLRPLTLWAVDHPVYMVLMVPPILGIPLLVQSQTWLAFVQASLDIRAYSRALMVTSVLGLVALVPLVLLWGLKGAAIHLFVFALIAWAVARLSARAATPAETRAAMRGAPFDWRVVRELSRFAAANLVPFVLTLGFPFVLRVQIVQDMGLTQNGIYQALYAISAQYLAIPLTAMTAYSFPRISQLRELGAINKEVDNAVRVAVLFSTAGILTILLLRDVVIHVLFSERFVAAVVLFPVQMVGDLIRSASFAIQLPLLPQERHRARNIMAVIHYGTFAAVFFSVPPAQRVWGAVWGHTLSWLVHFVMHALYVRHTNGFRFSRETLRLLVTSAVAVVSVAVLPFPDLGWRALGAVIALLWALTSVRREEVRSVFDLVRARLDAAGRRGER